MAATTPIRRRFALLATALAATLLSGAGGFADSASAGSSTQHVISAVSGPGKGFVSFPVDELRSHKILSGRLIHGSASRPLTARRLQRAARHGILRVRRSSLPKAPSRRSAAPSARRTTKLVVTAQDTNPLAGAKLYVDPSSNARQQADAWRESRPLDAAQMDKIAARSSADWFGDWNSDIRAAVDARMTTIAAAGALPVLVAYNIPLRDCSGYSAGGAGSPDAYRAWIRAFAAGIGTRPAVVILEPDALAALNCLTSEDRATRLASLKDAIEVLAAQGKVSVYVDAGNSAWVSASDMAQRLTSAGIAKARGFALNVSNFRWTSESATYGRAISDAIAGKPFVIDTSRNGVGPTADSQWCNPDGRALGPIPAASPESRVDAYLWIKRPGQSDGTCNGGPSAGAWWADYALGLAQSASQ